MDLFFFFFLCHIAKPKMNQSGIRAAIIHWNPACWGQCFQNDLDFAGASIWRRAHQKHFKCGGETLEVKHGRGLDDDDVFNVQMDQSDFLL